MTHNDIYTKFLIQYDKAGEATSYPSLTEYEIATFLDKAYNTLIAQKVTGNNYRRTAFEGDLKAVEDLAPLITEQKILADINQNPVGHIITPHSGHNYTVEKVMRSDVKDNRLTYSRPTDPEMLYFVNMYLVYHYERNDKTPVEQGGSTNGRLIPTKLISHQMAEKFTSTISNVPWIKTPVCYLEGDKIYVLYDLCMMDKYVTNSASGGLTGFTPYAYITYIKKPNTFVKDDLAAGTSFFDDNGTEDPRYVFECNSTVAEELVSLAVSFALENVESQRLNSKLNMRGLEA